MLSAMKHVSCSCGYVVTAESAEGLLTAVETHVAAAHRNLLRDEPRPEVPIGTDELKETRS
jgi:hypothetical protein